MQFILDSVLTPLVTEERKELILSCVASLESLDYQAALDELHQVVEFNDSMGDNAMLLSRIDDIIWNAHDTIFKRHEVNVSTEATQEIRQSIVDVLSNFNNYIIPDQLLLLFEGGFMPEEILAQMVQLFTAVKADEAWPEILDVSPQLINTMREEIERQVRYRGLDDADPTPIARVRMINHFLKIVGNETFSMLIDLTQSGIRIATKPLNGLVEQSLTALDRKDPSMAALELFGLTLLSDTPTDKIERVVRDTVQDYAEGSTNSIQMLEAVKPLFAVLREQYNDTP